MSNKGFTITIFICSVIIGIMVWCMVIIAQDLETHNKLAFDAWVKLTGNEKHLTYDEWRVLKGQRALPCTSCNGKHDQ